MAGTFSLDMITNIQILPLTICIKFISCYPYIIASIQILPIVICVKYITEHGGNTAPRPRAP